MIKRKYLFLMTIILSALGGCTLPGTERRDAPTVFDLGPERSHAQSAGAAPAIDATLLIPPVSASPWLDNTGIQYRLAYEDASRPNAYAQNRWVVVPAQMLTQRLRARFAGATRGVITALDGAKADYVLRIELDDFSQLFAAAQSSKVVVRLRASLIDANTRALQGQRTFSVERPAAPDAPGAVQALVSASDATVEALLGWAAQTLKK
jgi:cholesterol transport system auxiliary component